MVESKQQIVEQHALYKASVFHPVKAWCLTIKMGTYLFPSRIVAGTRLSPQCQVLASVPDLIEGDDGKGGKIRQHAILLME